MKKLFWSIFILIPQFIYAQPKNVIVVIGSGMGYNHIQATANFTGETPTYTSFPNQAAVYTLPAMSQKITEQKRLKNFDSQYRSVDGWSDLNYLDSSAIDFASAGTALATGRPTGTAALGLGLDSTELASVLILAKNQGKALGLVTNTAISNSCLSAFFAKAYDASNKDTIIKQLNLSGIDLIICSGHPDYDSLGEVLSSPDYSAWGNKSRWKSLGETYPLTTIDAMHSSASTDISSNNYFGVSRFANFSDGSNLNLFPDQMSFALNSLNANAEGFTAFIESRQIEYASRQGNKENVITEMQIFNKTVDSIINWVEANSNWDETALIVLGSFESGMLADTTFDRSKSNLTALRKVDAKIVAGEYNFTINSTQNTNALTPFFAKGSGTDDIKYYTDQTDYYREAFTSLPEIGRIIRDLHQKPEYKIPQNIILIVADGCGRNQIQAGKYYYGKTPVFESFPVRSFVSTYPGRSATGKDYGAYNMSYSSDRAWGMKSFLFGYNNVTCSASSGLAMASGKKSYYYGMGLDLDFNALNTIVQHSKSLGKSAGTITTETINNATPSAFAAHNISRKSMGSISLELLNESKLDVIIGSGHPDYDNNAQLADSSDYAVFGSKENWDAIKAGQTTLPLASNSGWNTVQDIDGDGHPDAWQLITENEDFSKIGGSTSVKRLLGIPHVPVTFQSLRSGDSTVVNPNNRNAVPHLSTLATAGLNVLNQNEKGFFAMIEAGGIDGTGHTNQKGRMLEEVNDFFQMVDSVVAWIEKNGGWEKNLLIVTADHETGLLTGEKITNDTIKNFYPIKDNGVGVMPGMVFNHKDHSNQLVNFYAKGAGAEMFTDYADEYDFFLGAYLTNSEIGESFFKLWNGTPGTIRNHPPIVLNRIPAQSAVVGQEFSLVIPQGIFADTDGDGGFELDAIIPKMFRDWLTFDKATSTLSGIPTIDNRGSVDIRAFDGVTTGAGLSVSTGFNLTVTPSTSVSSSGNNSVAFPNPVTSSQVIQFTADCKTVRMINTDGEIVFETNNPTKDNRIEIGSLPRGSYILQYIGTMTETQTIIIE